MSTPAKSRLSSPAAVIVTMSDEPPNDRNGSVRPVSCQLGVLPMRVPLRSPQNDLQGRAPAPGWEARYDWAGGLVLLSVAADGATVAPDIHALAQAAGGSAMLLRDRAGAAPCAMFAAQPAPLAALSARVRAAFDPDGVFANRMATN